MINLDENRFKVPFLTRMKVHKEQKKLLKSGYDNQDVLCNKNGDVAIFSYKTPAKKELQAASILKRDGRHLFKTFRTLESPNDKDLSFKIIETWNQIKNDSIFNKRTYIEYKDSKIPEIIYTMYSDLNSDDGVKMEITNPRDDYIKRTQQTK